MSNKQKSGTATRPNAEEVVQPQDQQQQQQNQQQDQQQSQDQQQPQDGQGETVNDPGVGGVLEGDKSKENGDHNQDDEIAETPSDPEETENGVLKNGPEPEHEVMDEQGPSELVKKLMVLFKEDQPTDMIALINRGNEEGNILTKALIYSLNELMERAAPGIPMQPQELSPLQYSVFEALFRIVESPDYDVFREGFSVFLAYISATNGKRTALNDAYIARYMHAWKKDPDKASAFQELFAIGRVVTGENMTPKKIAQEINISLFGKNVVTDTGHNNLTKLFKLN